MTRVRRERSVGGRNGSGCGGACTSTAPLATIPRLAVIVLMLAAVAPPLVSSDMLPSRYEVRRKQTQCLHTKFDQGEHATFSVFILDSTHGALDASISVDGPLRFHEERVSDGEKGRAQKAIQSGIEVDTSSLGYQMQQALRQYHEDSQHIDETEAQMRLSDKFRIDFTHSGEEEDAISARADASRENRARVDNGDSELARTILPDTVEPYEFTRHIALAGWYRFCLSADYSQLLVEMDIRSSAELGGLDGETGHVYSHGKREEMDEDARIDEMGKFAAAKPEKQMSEDQKEALENQVTAYDLEETQSLIRKINRLVGEMSKSQQDSHRRMKAHEGTAKRNYDKIVFASAVETLFYILITAFQVYTIHKWLRSGNMLGK